MLSDEDIQEPKEMKLEHDTMEQDDISTSYTINYHAMSGNLVLKTLRFVGTAWNSQEFVLLDTGSMSKFIQSKVAKKLSLIIPPSPSIQVMIGNRRKLQSEGLC